MTVKQSILRIIYPFWIWFTKLSKHYVKQLVNEHKSPPPSPVYDLSVQLNNGKLLPLAESKGKKILFVNTASDCGYTNQYADLQKLYEDHKDKLVIIGFPANDFKEQEKGTDDQIAQFCSVNYGVSFPLAKKSSVLKSPSQNEVFRWLSHKELNGWTNKQPSWNFSKYLVNEEGILTHYFDPSVEPLGPEVVKAINS